MKRNGQVYFALIGSILSAIFLSFGVDLFAQDDSDTQARSLNQTSRVASPRCGENLVQARLSEGMQRAFAPCRCSREA